MCKAADAWDVCAHNAPQVGRQAREEHGSIYPHTAQVVNVLIGLVHNLLLQQLLNDVLDGYDSHCLPSARLPLRTLHRLLRPDDPLVQYAENVREKYIAPRTSDFLHKGRRGFNKSFK